MCGIAGFFGFSNNVELAGNANFVQRHRGPDFAGLWHDDHIALAHQRLSIIDLSDSANQPMVKNGLVIVFNGEIYNYKELKKSLEDEKKFSFETFSDTEVILAYYQIYGKSCLDYFIGMFAFAIYDTRDNSLFIARDHFGIKPLFYTMIGNAFAFSSELKTLVRIDGFDKSINSKALVSCLNYLWISGNDTMFNGCFKLPAAHYLTLKDDHLTIKCYWQLDDQKYFEGSENQIKQELTKELEDAVRRHMVADVPVSTFLSGGLDSSLISVLAKENNDDLSTFTIGTRKSDKKIEQMPDDEKYAKKVAGLFNIRNNVIHLEPNILKELPEMAYTLDEPIGDPAAINTYLICKTARERGIKVLLSGMGADEIFFGYRRQKATLMVLRYNRLPHLIRRIIQFIVDRLPVRLNGRGFKISRWAKRFLNSADLPPDEAYMRSYSYYSENQLRDLITEKYISGIAEIKEEHRQLFYSKFHGDIVNQICNVDINMFMQGLNLTYSDRASMASSVEVRVPFIDKIFIEKVMQIPGNLKFRKGISKYILKRSAEKILPSEIIYRPKASFGAPLRSWISNDLRGMVDDLLSKENIEKRGFLNYAFVQNIIQKDRKGEEDYAYQIYQLLTLELWCREFLDK